MALTKEDIQLVTEITSQVAAKIGAEMRKPTEIEQKLLDEDKASKKMAQAERFENSKNVKAQMEARRREQLACTHAHADGHTHLVHVQENGRLAGGAGYLHCQSCQAKIRPDNENVKQLDPHAIFDTALFNRLYQTLPNREIFG